jgi:hypothetical protein
MAVAPLNAVNVAPSQFTSLAKTVADDPDEAMITPEAQLTVQRVAATQPVPSVYVAEFPTVMLKAPVIVQPTQGFFGSAWAFSRPNNINKSNMRFLKGAMRFFFAIINLL